ncbi:MAG: exosortase [Natronospirillum sp.]|uniref:exosortase n=1 Tax=Natronospirillum sp. TaxID=2812955 RepID=UPI0025EC0480|nr:exosortase [Natronospirillum sp.]MCH8551559.1 exosortase [Natronospirillum sp.]
MSIVSGKTSLNGLGKVSPVAAGKTGLLALIITLPFLDTWTVLARQWLVMDHELAHGSVIALATLWFIYRLGAQTERQAVLSSNLWLGSFLVVGFTVLATLSQRVGLDVIAQISLVALLYGLVLIFFPQAHWIEAGKVVGLLVFALQAWAYGNDILLLLASAVVGEAVSWLSIPTLIDGNSITIPYGIMLIADGCSGLRYFVISLALAWMLAILNRYTLAMTALALLAAAVLALIANWIRIYALILVGYFSEMQSSLVYEHETFGWVLFAAMILPAIYFAPQPRRAE